MHPLAGRKVSKMNGLGNEIVILDLRGAPYAVSAADVRAIDRDPHLSFDQLMVLEDPRHAGTEAFIRIFNTDGSEAGACGNGTRCVAWSLMNRCAERSGRQEDRSSKVLHLAVSNRGARWLHPMLMWPVAVINRPNLQPISGRCIWARVRMSTRSHRSSSGALISPTA